MSRMFRVVNGQNPADLRNEAKSGSSLGTDSFHGSAVPFVEVGPEGVTSSVASAPPVPQSAKLTTKHDSKSATRSGAPKSNPTPTTTQHQPGDSRHLSITFHRLTRQSVRTNADGIAAEAVVHHHPDHAVSAEYRVVRNEIVSQFDTPGPRVALFSAAIPSSGTTTVLINLAITLCQEHGSRVLLVDANFDKPGVARRLCCAETPGLGEVLGQTLPLAWTLQPTPVTNLHVLAAGQPSEQTEESMINDFPKLIAQLRQWFDWVIIDGGIWNELPGSEIIASHTDVVYLVSRTSDLSADDFTELKSELLSSNAPLNGYIGTRY